MNYSITQPFQTEEMETVQWCVCIKKIMLFFSDKLGGGTQIFFIVTPKIGEDSHFD